MVGSGSPREVGPKGLEPAPFGLTPPESARTEADSAGTHAALTGLGSVNRRAHWTEPTVHTADVVVARFGGGGKLPWPGSAGST